MARPFQLLWVALTTALSCFLAGIYFQHRDANRQLQQLIQKDPYAYYVSPRLYGVFRFFNPPNDVSQHTRLKQIMKYGFPGLDDVRLYSDFVLSYDRRNRVAHWVCEHLRPEALHALPRTRARRRRSSVYKPDFRIPSNFRSALADYHRSGFDRGHLAAAANHHGHSTHCNETFYLTNIAPQIGKGFNRAAWNRLEAYVRDLTRRYLSVFVYTGPLYKPRRQANGKCSIEYELIGANMVAVPTHFFKVIIVESQLPLGKPYMEAYVLPNAKLPDNVKLRDFLCDIREIEHLAGLQFFHGLRHSMLFGSNYPNESQVFRNFT